MNAEAELRRRLRQEFLPEWCQATGLDPNVLDLDRRSWSERLAQRFLRAMDAGVVTRRPGARFAMPRTKSSVTLFWHGPANVDPRSILLANEALIVMSWAGALHLDYGWPTAHLGFESDRFEFDLVAYGADDCLVIAGEAKPTQGTLDALVRDVRICGAIGHHTETQCGVRRNHHRKYTGLVGLAPSVFWVLGPESSRQFAVLRFGGGRLSLTESPDAILRYPFQT